MWTRVELKTKAKAFLKDFYWNAFIVTLVLMIASGAISGNPQRDTKINLTLPLTTSEQSELSSFLDGNIEPSIQERGYSFFFNLLPMGIPQLFMLTGFIGAIAILLSMAISVFILDPLNVGVHKFFIKGATEQEVSFSHLGFSYRREYYLNIVWVLFYKTVLNLFFYMLLFIPGVIKSYSYSMVPYLLAENPTIEAAKAIEISEAMTEGHKWEMFVLDLSFILWHALGFVTFGLSKYAVAPYIYATRAQLYLVLKPLEPTYNQSPDLSFA